MSFLLDTDICSAYLKNDRAVANKVMLHFGGLSVSVITVGELLTWALRAKASPNHLRIVNDFLAAVSIVDVNFAVAQKFGELRAMLFDQGKSIGPMDLLNASIALVHNMALVTHNVADYAMIPGLNVEDWQVP